MMNNSVEAEYESARLVADDLDFIINSWTLDISEGSIRRGSPLLRRLLTENAYLRAWRFVGLPDQPRVKATNLEYLLGTINRNYVAYAYAGVPRSLKFFSGSISLRNPGDVRKGDLMIANPGYVDSNGPLFIVIPKKVAEDVSRDGSVAANHFGQQLRNWMLEDYRLSKFLESASVVVKNDVIQRQDVVKYVSNKLGGAHFSPKRSAKEHKYAILDKQHARYNALRAIYLELLSIGQFIGESEDARRYLEAFSQLEVEDEVEW